jgi:hypothetical protein
MSWHLLRCLLVLQAQLLLQRLLRCLMHTRSWQQTLQPVLLDSAGASLTLKLLQLLLLKPQQYQRQQRSTLLTVTAAAALEVVAFSRDLLRRQ